MSRTLLAPLFLAFGLVSVSAVAARLHSVEFQFWPSSSAFVLAGDEASLLFSENGPDGLVLKRADLHSGKVSIVRKLAGGDHRFATIPGSSTQIAAAAQCCFAKSPSEIWLMQLAGGKDIRLNVGENGSDGSLFVSPSGRYLATGTDYVCSGGERDCFPRAVSVFSILNGVQELAIPVAFSESDAPSPLGNDYPAETRRSSTLQSVAWRSEDVLVVETYGSPSRAFRRVGAGKWTPTNPGPKGVHRPPAERVYAPSVEISTTSGKRLETVLTPSLFDERPGVVWILRGRRGAVLLKAFPPRDDSTKWFSVVAYHFGEALE